MPCWHTTAPCVDSLCRHPTDSRSCIWSAAIAYCFGCVQRWRLVRQLAFFGHHRVLSVCVDAAIIAWTISRKKLENILNSYFFGDMIRPTQQTTQRQQPIEVATHAPCCGTQGKTRVSVEAGDPSVSEFRGFAVTRPANDGCTGMIASTAVSTLRTWLSVHAGCSVQR